VPHRDSDDSLSQDEITQILRNRAHNGGIRTTVMSWVLASLTAVVGWMATDASTSRAKMLDQIQQAQQEVAVIKESNRNIRETLVRIETLLEVMRQRQEERPRR